MKPRDRTRRRPWRIVLGALALAAGCNVQESTPAPPVRRPSTKIDPCADRLHDLCGRLLLHHSLHGQFPQSLNQLEKTGVGDAAPLTCPVSGRPYVYRPSGLRIPNQPGLLIVHDAEASHSGMRWGILMDEPGSGRPPTLRVILLSEQAFSAALSRP
ncbi:MAG TPA: hypothetical protein VNA25_18255 [Phycisphaerae bacterium]|nr:hypothetical protein [Phycisphaerae bacterium]